MTQDHLSGRLTRRTALAGGGALLAARGGRAMAQGATQGTKQAPITIVINQSPWFEGFRKTVELYRTQTGNQVALDVNPFAGSLEKQRTAARSGESPFDIFVINAGFFVEMYAGGFLRPLNEIDAGFKLDPAVYTFDSSVFWNPETKRVDAATGKLMTVPINPYIPLMHYRTDLYEAKKLTVPKTWDELLANAKALQNPPRLYGIVQRGDRGAFDVTYDVLPDLWSHGGDIFKDQKGGDFTVTINSAQTLAGLETYLRLAKEAGHPHTAGQTQTDVIEAMATGRAAHIIAVLAASQFDDPSKSAVVGKVGFAPPPAAPGYKTSPPLGHWLGGIPRNIPEARQKAALAFLGWFQQRDSQMAYAKAGSPPVRRDVLESDLAKEPAFRWMPALAAALPFARLTFVIPQAAEVLAITELRFNQAIGGDMTAVAALNTMSAEIAKVMVADGYTAPRLPDLKG
jgi:multiple sugar transport system substrate-binding protein